MMPIQTLLIYANGYGFPTICKETFWKGIFRLPPGVPPPWKFDGIPVVRKFFQEVKGYDSLCYVNDWKNAFVDNPELDVQLCNINNLIEYARFKKAVKTYPLVIILHSAFGDDTFLLDKTVHWFAQRKGKLLVLVGNEYDLLPEKIAFLQKSRADYIGTQLPLATGKWLYKSCRKSKVIPTPHALNPQNFFPNNLNRTYDIGFAGNLYPFFIGDQERNSIILFFHESGKALGLNCSIQFRNVHELAWANLLNSSKGTIGGEATSYYIDKNGEAITKAKKYLAKNPRVSFKEVFDKFFRNLTNFVSAKGITSRHFEAIGTKTCQILLEGEYNGILKANEHYIPVKKDLSNIEEAVAAFKDETFRNRIVRQAYDLVIADHTYSHRVEYILQQIGV